MFLPFPLQATVFPDVDPKWLAALFARGAAFQATLEFLIAHPEQIPRTKRVFRC